MSCINHNFVISLLCIVCLCFIWYVVGWDLEQNKVVRNYHGHLSGVYTLELHPTLDLLITGGRDSVARVGRKLLDN